MRALCAHAASAALGRPLTESELNHIEERIKETRRTLARRDPQAWRSMSLPDQISAAAGQAAQDLLGETALKQERLGLKAMAAARITTYVRDATARGIPALEALEHVIAFKSDGKANFLSIESQARAVSRDAIRQMLTTIEASNPKWFGLIANAEGERAILKELFGEHTGNVDAAKGAKEFHQVAEQLRQRFNRAGGDVGKLEDWGIPQHHSQLLVAKAGRARWVADVLPRLDRQKYVNEDGTFMNDAEVSDFLGHAWETIATGGANKREPGVGGGTGMRASRGSESRQVHFKNADAYLEYQNAYGERAFYDVLTGHIENIAKDVALVETLGPNPDQTFRYFKDALTQAEKIADPVRAGKIDEHAGKVESYYNEVSGKHQPIGSELLAKSFDTLRSWLIAARLGSSVITSFSDDATLHLTGQINHLPAMRLLANELAALNPTNRLEERLANRAGLGLHTVLASLNRFGQAGLGSNFSSKLANATMRVSGLNAMTEARKRGFGVTMMGAIGSVARDHTDLGKIDPVDHRMLLSKGITPQDFAVWKLAKLEDWGDGNDTMLTPESIYQIPDTSIDAVIAPEHARIRAEAQGHIDELNRRNQQDQLWLTKRATDLNSWLADARTRFEQSLADKSAKIDTAAQAKIERVRERITKFEEQLDVAASSWMTPEGDVPGVDSSQPVSFYGKPTLRRMGKQEGAAQQAIQNLQSDVAGILRETKQGKEATANASLKDLFERFTAKQSDLAEFAKRASDRAIRRQLVADRIARQVDPALAGARATAREQAATRLLGAILEETDVAVIEPGVRERVLTGSQIQRGTWKGELTRSFFLFKSFPLAMITRHWNRGMSLPNVGGRAAYIATLMAATTVLGMASLQVSEVLAGRDPRNLNPAAKGGVRNWIAAMLKGGSLGIYGDFLFSDATSHGSSPLGTLTGPVLGTVEDLANLTQGNIIQAAQGKKTNAGAEAVRFVRGNTPGASLWYAKGALDHLLWNRLAEHASPGYLAHMRRRYQQQYGQDAYWQPGTTFPQRAPDLAAAVGE